MNCPKDLVVLDVEEADDTASVNVDLRALDCRGHPLGVLLSEDTLTAGVGEQNFQLLSATSARDGRGNFAECLFHVRVRGQEELVC